MDPITMFKAYIGTIKWAAVGILVLAIVFLWHSRGSALAERDLARQQVTAVTAQRDAAIDANGKLAKSVDGQNTSITEWEKAGAELSDQVSKLTIDLADSRKARGNKITKILNTTIPDASCAGSLNWGVKQAPDLSDWSR